MQKYKHIKVICSIQILALICWLHVYEYAYAKYPCGHKDDGYVCCRSYHTFGHERFLMTLEGNKSGPKGIKVVGFSAANKKKIDKVINKWNEVFVEASANKFVYLLKRNNNEQIYVQSTILERGTHGYTQFYKAGGALMDSHNGKLASKYAKVIISVDEDQGYVQQTAAHEIGHALGLTHRICNNKSIMYNFVNTVNVTLPQAIDGKTARHIYTYC